MQTSWKELGQLFKLKGRFDRTIKNALINKIRVIDHNHVELKDEQIKQLLLAFRVSGSYTVNEISGLLGISGEQVRKMVKHNQLSSYQLSVGKGSQLLFLKSEFEQEHAMLIKQFKRYNPDRLIKLINQLAEDMLNAGSLTRREYDMLTGYYLENKTLHKIGEQIEVSLERARQLVEKFSLKFLHTMRYTLTVSSKISALQQACIEVQDRNQQLEKFIKDNHWQTIPPATSHVPAVYAYHVNELDLPIRVINVLNYAKIETVMDLVDYGKKRLLNHRNFGARSMRKVEEALKKIGIDY